MEYIKNYTDMGEKMKRISLFFLVAMAIFYFLYAGLWIYSISLYSFSPNQEGILIAEESLESIVFRGKIRTYSEVSIYAFFFIGITYEWRAKKEKTIKAYMVLFLKRYGILGVCVLMAVGINRLFFPGSGAYMDLIVPMIHITLWMPYFTIGLYVCSVLKKKR